MVQAIRISTMATETLARLMYKLGIFMYCQKIGGRPQDIANNPGGMNMITVGTEDLEKFKTVAKEYKLKYFAVSDRENPITDICIRMEDTALLRRILERCEIGVLKETKAAALDNESAEKIEKMQGKSFARAAEKMKEYSQSLDEALNRNTDADFAKDTPYYIAERTKPDTYIRILPEAAEFDGKSYTKSTYSVYKDGEFVKSFDDGRFEGRSESYWQEVKNAIKESGSFSDDLVYLGGQEVFDAYSTLYSGGKGKNEVQIASATEQDIKEAASEFLAECKGAKENPPQAPAEKPESKTASEHGKDKARTEESRIKKTVNEKKKDIDKKKKEAEAAAKGTSKSRKKTAKKSK